MPFGGARQLTPALAMVAKLPVLGGRPPRSAAWPGASTRTFAEANPTPAPTSLWSSPWRSSWPPALRRATCTSPSRSTSRSCARSPSAGASPAPPCWARSWRQVDFGVGAIGGKDSMSGTFEDLDVPPTLVSFATAIGSVDALTSPEFKEAGTPGAIWAPVDDGWRPSAGGRPSSGGALDRRGQAWRAHAALRRDGRDAGEGEPWATASAFTAGR